MKKKREEACVSYLMGATYKKKEKPKPNCSVSLGGIFFTSAIIGGFLYLTGCNSAGYGDGGYGGGGYGTGTTTTTTTTPAITETMTKEEYTDFVNTIKYLTNKAQVEHTINTTELGTALALTLSLNDTLSKDTSLLLDGDFVANVLDACDLFQTIDIDSAGLVVEGEGFGAVYENLVSAISSLEMSLRNGTLPVVDPVEVTTTVPVVTEPVVTTPPPVVTTKPPVTTTAPVTTPPPVVTTPVTTQVNVSSKAVHHSGGTVYKNYPDVKPKESWTIKQSSRFQDSYGWYRFYTIADNETGKQIKDPLGRAVTLYFDSDTNEANFHSWLQRNYNDSAADWLSAGGYRCSFLTDHFGWAEGCKLSGTKKPFVAYDDYGNKWTEQDFTQTVHWGHYTGK